MPFSSIKSYNNTCKVFCVLNRKQEIGNIWGTHKSTKQKNFIAYTATISRPYRHSSGAGGISNVFFCMHYTFSLRMGFFCKYFTGMVYINTIYYLLFTVHSRQSTNFSIFYKEPFDNNERCNWYGKDGNTGPSYSCNQTGQIVAIRRFDTGRSVLSVCNITAYGGWLTYLFKTMPMYLILTFHRIYLHNGITAPALFCSAQNTTQEFRLYEIMCYYMIQSVRHVPWPLNMSFLT